MKNQTRQMIKDVIQENAVSFKDSASKVLYTKVKDRLNEQYKTVARSIFIKKENNQ